MATCVPVINTECSEKDRIKGLILGWIKSFKEMPKKESIGVLIAQNNIETGGSTHMYNWNLGNVKYVPSKNPDDDNDIKYMMLNNVWEIINGKKIIFQPPHQATWFRAFDTLEDGIGFHLNFLKNKRYKNSWSAIEAGDPAQFAHLLKVAGYYTAPEADYVKGMNFHFNKFMKDNTFEEIVKILEEQSSSVGSVVDLFTETFNE